MRARSARPQAAAGSSWPGPRFMPVAAIVGGDVKQHCRGGFADPSAESTRAARLLETRFANGAPNVVVLVTATGGAEHGRRSPSRRPASKSPTVADDPASGREVVWGLFGPAAAFPGRAVPADPGPDPR